MARFSVFTTDANPQLLYSTDERHARVDRWTDQLARVSNYPADLFVAPSKGRVAWSFRASRGGTSSREGLYLANYTSADAESAGELFSGLADQLTRLREEEGWQFSASEELRWQAGFELPAAVGNPPEIGAEQREALERVVSGNWGRVGIGMSSYGDALRLVAGLSAAGVDGTVAINSNGLTPETEGIDLVIWPDADRDYAPMNEQSRAALAEAGFAHESELSVLDAEPSASQTTIKDRHNTTSPVESFVGDGLGRLGAGLLVVLSAATIGSLLPSRPMGLYPLSGISALGGLLGAAAGLYLTPRLLGPLTGGDDSSFLLSPKQWEWQQFTAYFGLALLLSYAFPTVIRTLSGDWEPYGVPNTLGMPVAWVGIYVAALLLAALVAYVALSTKFGDSPAGSDIASLVGIHLLFLVGLVVGNGLSCGLWFPAIGFSGGC